MDYDAILTKHGCCVACLGFKYMYELLQKS